MKRSHVAFCQCSQLPQSLNLGVIVALAKPFDLLALANQVAIALNWN